MKETKIYADEFCTTFASTTEMLEFLAERAKQSKWIRKPTRMLKLVPLEKEAETIEEACEKELEGIVEDTEKNTQLVLKVNKDFYPVRDCAIHTILKRAGINGTGLKKLEKATYAKVQDFRNNLDKIFSRYQEAVKGIVGLMDIDIQNPVNCLHLIMKELKINQKIRNEVVELFVGQYGEEPCTAHDLYFAMHEAAFFAACEGFSAPRILKLEEDIAKTLVFDWKGFDVYGTIKL